MNRNLSRRVELLFPILQDDIRERIIKIFSIMWADNVKTRVLQPDSTWTRVQLRGVTKLNAQAYFIKHAVAMGEALRREEIDQAPEDLHATHTFTPMTAPKEDDDA